MADLITIKMSRAEWQRLLRRAMRPVTVNGAAKVDDGDGGLVISLAGNEGEQLQQEKQLLTITEVKQNYLLGTNAAGTIMAAAKPRHLRPADDDNAARTYSEADITGQTRTYNEGESDEETHNVLPAYAIGDTITIEFVPGGTGTNTDTDSADESLIMWRDDNIDDARRWSLQC